MLTLNHTKYTINIHYQFIFVDRQLFKRFHFRYNEGLPSGECWVRVVGNGWHVGHVDSRWKMHGHGAYLYSGDLLPTRSHKFVL